MDVFYSFQVVILTTKTITYSQTDINESVHQANNDINRRQYLAKKKHLRELNNGTITFLEKHLCTHKIKATKFQRVLPLKSCLDKQSDALEFDLIEEEKKVFYMQLSRILGMCIMKAEKEPVLYQTCLSSVPHTISFQ